MASTPTAKAKIDELRQQIDQLTQQAVKELEQKIAEARRAVKDLEAELATLTGQSAREATVRRVRRPSITDEALQDQILKVMANGGKAGLNAKQLADKLNQDALRVRKFIKDNPKVLKRQGTGPGTKFLLP